MNSKEIGVIVRYHRKRAKLSRERLAMLAGVGKTAVFDIEHGKETVQFRTLLSVLRILNITLHLDSPLIAEYQSSQKVQEE